MRRRHHRHHRHHRRNPAAPKKKHHALEWIAAGTVGALLVATVFGISSGAINVQPPGLMSGGI
jgi:hypothetical protein